MHSPLRRALPLLRRGLVGLAMITLGCACSALGMGGSRDLRLRHVVLYQNGIGYFERTGMLKSDRMRLQFREREIDDVLKSLVVVEEGVGPRDKASTVSALLPQTDAKKPPDAEDATSLELVLSPATRRSVSIAYAVPTAAWKATYRILLPDPAQKPSRGALLQAWALIDNVSDEDWSGVNLTLATGAPLSYVSNLRAPRFITRPQATGVADEFGVVGPIASERSHAGDTDADGIPDSMDRCPDDAEGNGDDGCPDDAARVVTTSELVVLEPVTFERDSDKVRTEALPSIDAIASAIKSHAAIHGVTIEGHSSSDEHDPWGISARRAAAVRTLLLGKGVAIEISVKSLGDTRPVVAANTEEGKKRNRRVEVHVDEPKADRRGATPAGVADAAAMSKSPSVGSPPRDVAGSIRYDITNAVSIPRRSSTLVTIINEYVPGEDIFLYRPDPSAPASATYPFRAARIENKGHLGLQPGAVSIFAGGTFVGEGILNRLNPGETALIPYALDSSTQVRVTSDGAEDPVRILALVRGVLTVENLGRVTTRYQITPGKQATATLFVRHERRQGYEVKGLPPNTETTASAYLIPVPIDAGKPSVLTVEEVRPKRRELTILATDGSKLSLYLAGSALSPDVDKQVRALVTQRIELGKIDQGIEALRSQLSDAGQRSTELRESLRAIEKTARAGGLQQKLVERLTEATTRSEQLSAKLAERSAAQAEARARIEDGLRDLRIDEKEPAAGATSHR